MNGTEIVALGIETRAAHRAYLEAAALRDPPVNITYLAWFARNMIKQLERALQDYKGDGL